MEKSELEKIFYKRIDYTGKLEDISEVICKDFKIGNFKSNELIPVGYEDFNFKLSTTKNNYFVKIFSNLRTDDDCKNCVEEVLKVMEKGVAVPRLLKSDDGYLVIKKINDVKLRFCVSEFVNGKDFYLLKVRPNINEMKFLAQQAALINSINYKPKFIYDEWAITNFEKEFAKKEKYLDSEDLKLIQPIVKEYKKMEIEKLPHCFVHGDLIATNVIRAKHGKIWVIDFSVANYFPRIQELAVLACDMLFDRKSKIKSDENLALALKEYQKIIKLTSRELEVLSTYIKFAHIMHVLSATYCKKVEKNKTKENEYFLNIGRLGLKQMLN
jgi:Ser/Thr protein kinase RdoA (MazF antagonist)